MTFLTDTYAIPESAAELIPIMKEAKSIFGSKFFMTMIPLNEIAKNNHCFQATFSFRIRIPKNAVEIGERYCKVTAEANGIRSKTMKNMVNATEPLSPLMIKYFLLFPKNGIFFLPSKVKVITKETKHLKKTFSNAGNSKILTMVLTIAKLTDEISM